MASNPQVADALRPILCSFEVDNDMLEELERIVSEAAAANQEGSVRALAAELEEQLEPFMVALGAELGSIPGAMMQVAVALRGVPDLGDELIEASTLGTASGTAVAQEVRVDERPVAGSDASGVGKAAMTLADFCSSGTPMKPPQSSAARMGTALGAQSLGALWAKEVDPNGDTSKAWKMGCLTPGNTASLDDLAAGECTDEEEEAVASLSTSEKEKNRHGIEKQARRTARLTAAAAAAAAAPLPPTSVEEQLGDVAAHGLRETQKGLADNDGNSLEWERCKAAGTSWGGRGRGGRGVHIEGAGSRNIHLEDVSLTLTGDHGSHEVLRSTNLHLSGGHVYGLVGKNGTGKTTLLRRLAACALPGMPTHLRFGYVPQELAAVQGEQSILDAVIDSDEERRMLLAERDELDAALVGAENLRDEQARAGADASAQRFAEIEQRLEAMDADGAENRARDMLLKLGFSEASMHRPVSTLSGGWRMRLALAQALCGNPDVLLLDEPTNHLDLHGVVWLQEHIRCHWGFDAKKKDRIVVVVSHDRSFMDACVTDILEIHACKLKNYTGNYSSYLDRIVEEQRCLHAMKDEAERQERQAKKDLSNMKKKAREHGDDKKIRQLKSKEKRYERGVDEKRFKLSSKRDPGRNDGADRAVDLLSKLREDVNLRFRFPEVEILTDANLLEWDGARVRQGRDVILSNLTLTLDSTSRVAIVGSNGSGKSTLIKAICGELKADEGPRGRGRMHQSFNPGFVTQNHFERQARSLHANSIDYLREHLPDEKSVRGSVVSKQSDDSILRAHLGNFGLGNDALKKVGYLSGGQKARLSLAAAMLHQPNVLLLDEPTNHLDIDSLDALSLGLQAFQGAVVVVSHNRGFLEAVCDELWIVRNGTMKACPRGEEAFAEFFAQYAASVRSFATA